jgi:hypothetical protein
MAGNLEKQHIPLAGARFPKKNKKERPIKEPHSKNTKPSLENLYSQIGANHMN